MYVELCLHQNNLTTPDSSSQNVPSLRLSQSSVRDIIPDVCMEEENKASADNYGQAIIELENEGSSYFK